MKKTLFILISTLFIISSCRGPRGFDGTDGRDGIDGESFMGSLFEIIGTFDNSNDYSLYFDFSEQIKVYETDIILVYILWKVIINENNEEIDVWKMLPQVRFLEKGVLKYDFDYTHRDIQIYLEGDINFNDLERGDVEDQLFRIAVLPADFLKSSEKNGDENINFENMNIIKMY